MTTPQFTCPIQRLWNSLRSVENLTALCYPNWDYIEMILPWRYFGGSFSFILAGFCLSIFESHPKINLNVFYSNEWPHRSENWVPDVYLFKLCSLILAPNHWYFGAFHLKIPQYLKNLTKTGRFVMLLSLLFGSVKEYLYLIGEETRLAKMKPPIYGHSH